MENENIFCIYKIINIINGKIYIGQTTQNLEKRMSKHFSDAKTKRKKSYKIHNAINKYGRDNFKYEVIEYVDNQILLNERECYWIKYYDCIKNGYNILVGGMIGRSKIWLGRKHTEETKKKMSIAQKGKIVSDITKQKLSKAKMNSIMPSSFEHPNSINIVQINKDTYELINIFGSIREAEISINGHYTGNIHNVINNNKTNKTAYGYVWLTIDEYEHNKNNISKYIDNIFENYIYYGKTKIVQLDYKGNYINQFDSILEAQNLFNDTCIIRSCLKKSLKIAHGYQWDTFDNYNIYINDTQYYIINDNILNKDKILQISMLGDNIIEWNNIFDIVNYYKENNTRNIKHAIDNGNIYINNFWIYYNDYINYNNIWNWFMSISKCKNIIQFSLNNEIIKIWDNAKCIQDTHPEISSNVLLRKLNKNNNLYKNYKWMRLFEYNYIQSEKKNQSFIINDDLGITDVINTIIK